MTTTTVRMTDPAQEFANLAATLRAFKQGEQQATYQVLAEFFGVDSNNPQLFELIGFVATRSVRLREFIDGLNDEYLDDEVRSELIATLNNITQVISPKRMQTPWHQVQSTFLQSSQIVMLRQFSQTARRYKPLRAVSVEEKKDLLQKISEAINELKEDKDLPTWTVNLITEGLQRLRLMITHLDVFGHEAVIDHLIGLNAEIDAASKTLAERGKEWGGKIWKTAVVISAGIGILVAPLKAEEAYRGYKAYALQIVENPPALLAAPVKMLADGRARPKSEQLQDSAAAKPASEAPPPAKD